MDKSYGSPQQVPEQVDAFYSEGPKGGQSTK
jgi:hypothetical protein